MKKVFICFILGLMIFAGGATFFGCENATEIKAVSITEITSAGSENYGIKISYQDDKRIEKKGTDIQVKCDRKIDNIVIWHEGQEKKSIAFGEKDRWYSLTTLLAFADNKPNTEKFEEFGQALSKILLFNSKEKIKLTFRVVVGDIEPNVQGSGEVLTGSTEVSNEFILKFNQ